MMEPVDSTAAAVEDGRAAPAPAAAANPAPTAAAAVVPAPEPPQGFLSKLNDLLNEDYVYDIAYYCFWAGFWLFVPYVVLFGLAGMAIYDAVTAKVRLPAAMR